MQIKMIIIVNNCLIFYLDTTAVAGKSLTEIQKLLVYRKKCRGSVTGIADRLGNPEPIENDWLKLTPKDKMPQPEKVAFPKPPKAADGSLLYERVPNKGDDGKPVPMVIAAPTPQAAKRRHNEDVNGVLDNSESEKSIIILRKRILFLFISLFFAPI